MATKEQLAWTPIKNNQILQGSDFYISYNKSTGNQIGHSIFTDIGNMLGGDFKDGEETALKNERTGEWFILEGDFREEYEKAFPKGLEACLKVYKKNIKNRSNWSTD